MSRIQNVLFTDKPKSIEHNKNDVGVAVFGDPQKTKYNETNVGVAVFGDPQKGITLIALVITIILLLILAGITIVMLTAENGIIEKTKYAKTVSEISEEKDAIHLSFTETKTERLLDGDILVKPSDLEVGIKKLTNKNVTADLVAPNENNKIRVIYEESKRQYIVEQNGKVSLLDERLVQGVINFTEATWSGGKAEITISTNRPEYYLEYQVGSIEGQWTQADKVESVTVNNIENDTTVYARLSDGINKTKYTSILIKDTTAPTVNVSITGTTSDGIIATVSATDGQTGMATTPTYVFYIKETAQADSTYTQIQSGTSTTCTKTGLKQNTSYTIKATTQDIGGNTGEGTKEGTTGVVTPGTITGAITYGAVNWSNGKASIPISTIQTRYYIEYQAGSTSGTWTRGASKGASITASGIANNQTIYARLSDGTNAGTYASMLIKDTTAPTVTVNITGTTSDGITASVGATDGQTGMATTPTYTFYIKETGALDSTYTQIQSGTSTTCNKAGLKQNTSYTIKVTTQDIGGNTGAGTKAGTTGEVPKGTVTGVIDYGAASWSSGKASITISTNQTGYYIEYQVGSTSGTWTRATAKGASITASNIANNATVYARLSDGTNVGTYATMTIKDTIAPEVTVTITGTTSDSITASVGATDSQTGMATTPTYTFYIKETAQADSAYTQIQSGTSTTCNKAGLKQNTSYTVKVTTTDIGGNTGTGTKEGTTGVVTPGTITGAITYGAVNWSNGKASIPISTIQTRYYIEYQVGSTSGTWTRGASKGVSITASNIANNATVYARLSDGTNAGTHASMLIKDTTAPTVTVNITGTTSDGITASVGATDGQTGMATTPTYTFYIKETAQADSAYTQIQSGTSTTCNKAGLKQNTSYTVKVTTTDIGGNTGTGTKAGTTGIVTPGPTTGAITYGTVSWSNGKASTTISTNQTGYYIEYQVGSTSGTWTRGASKGVSITASNIANNATVYARLSDGTNAGTHASMLIKDTIAPTVTVNIPSTTSSGITATASATDSQTGMATTPTYTFYIKETAQADSTYTQIQSGTNTTCTKAGLKQKTSYTIKVTTTDIGGNTGTGTKAGITGEVPTAITWGALSWSGGKASITISTSQTGYYIEYQVGSTSGTWTRATAKGASITASNIANNQTIYARLSDGTNAGTYGSLLVKDTTAPNVTVNITQIEGKTITATASATDGQTGMTTNPTYKYYIKVTNGGSYSTTPSYTGTNASYTFTGLTQLTEYTIKVTTIDIAGNTGTKEINATTIRSDVTATTSLKSKATNSIIVTANSNGGNGSLLTYKLYTSTSSSGTYTLKSTKTSVTPGVATELTATGLSKYTTYYYYVTVTDSATSSTTSTSYVKTYCPGSYSCNRASYCSGSPGRCEWCNGMGYTEPRTQRCSRCGGDGITGNLGTGDLFECSRCMGSGYEVESCSSCGGTGKAECGHGYTSSHYWCTTHRCYATSTSHSYNCGHGINGQHD